MDLSLLDELDLSDTSNLERSLLIASGAPNIDEYVAKMDEIHQGFLKFKGRRVGYDGEIPLLSKGIILYDYITHFKVEMYEEEGAFLPDLIDGFLHRHGQSKLGNCLALSSFYAALAIRSDITPRVWGCSQHVWLEVEGSDVDLTVERFGSKQEIDLPLVQCEPSALVAMTLNAKGSRMEDDLKRAIEFYNKAIAIEPREVCSYVNRAVAKFNLGDREGCLEDLKQARKIARGDINVNKKFVEYYEGIGNKRQARELKRRMKETEKKKRYKAKEIRAKERREKKREEEKRILRQFVRKYQ